MTAVEGEYVWSAPGATSERPRHDPAAEIDRLRRLHQLLALDTAADEIYDRLTRLAEYSVRRSPWSR